MSHINEEHNYAVEKHTSTGAEHQEYSYASGDDNVSVTLEDPSDLIRISSTVKDNANLKVSCTEQQYRIFKSKDPLNLKRISCTRQDPQQLVPVCSTIQHDYSRFIGDLNSPVEGPLNLEGTCENLDPRYLFYKCRSLPEGHKSINLKKLQNVSRAQCKSTDPTPMNQNISRAQCKSTDPTPMNQNISRAQCLSTDPTPMIPNIFRAQCKNTDPTPMNQNISRAQCKSTDPTPMNQNISRAQCKSTDPTPMNQNISRAQCKSTDPTPMNQNISRAQCKSTDPTPMNQNISRAQCKNTDPSPTNQNVSNVPCKRGSPVFLMKRTYVKILTDPRIQQRWPVYHPKRTCTMIPIDPIVMKMDNYGGVLSESRGQEVKQMALINRVDAVNKETCTSLKEKHEMHLDIHPPAFMNQTKPLEKTTDLMKEVKEKNLVEEGNNTFDNETSAELVKSVKKEKDEEEVTELDLVEEGITGHTKDTKMWPLIELVKPVKKEIEDVTHELDLLDEGMTGNNVGTKMWPLLELVKTVKKEIEEVTEMDCMEQEIISAEGGTYNLFQETVPVQSETNFVEERISPIGGGEELLDVEVEHVDSEATETASGKNMTEPTNNSALKKVSSRVVTLLGNGELAILPNKHLNSQTNGSFAFVRNNKIALVQEAYAEQMNME